MGNRAQICINRVYLYSHWGGATILKTLATALLRNERWDDPEYLTRIVFCEMVKNEDADACTGFGIGTSMHGDIEHPVPVLNCDSQTISWRGPGASKMQPTTFKDLIREQLGVEP